MSWRKLRKLSLGHNFPVWPVFNRAQCRLVVDRAEFLVFEHGHVSCLDWSCIATQWLSCQLNYSLIVSLSLFLNLVGVELRSHNPLIIALLQPCDLSQCWFRHFTDLFEYSLGWFAFDHLILGTCRRFIRMCRLSLCIVPTCMWLV